jgi:hypothetical protein
MTTDEIPAVHARWSRMLSDRATQPFVWGAFDCFCWAADVVRMVTGADPARGLRGAYADARGALRLAQQHGGLQALAGARFGPEVAAWDPPPGAVVLMRPNLCAGGLRELGALGVVSLDPAVRLVAAQGESGLVWAPITGAAMAWQGAAWRG